MQQFFVDTWFFIACFHRFDSGHRAAAALDRRLQRAGANLVTHDLVLTEFLSFMSGTGARNRQLAVDVVQQTVREHRSIAADRPLLLRALERYRRRPDKEYSLVDCMSMVVMEERGITHVLTNDHHFRQEGFTVVSE
jgi:predicted nucleic acid-binding protein